MIVAFVVALIEVHSWEWAYSLVCSNNRCIIEGNLYNPYINKQL